MGNRWGKRGDNILPLLTPFPILNQFIFPCPVLTVACWSAASRSAWNPNFSHLIVFKIVSISGLFHLEVFPLSSVQFSHSVVSDSLRPCELQHARPPCPSPTPGVHPNSCASSRWCHPDISSSVVPFPSQIPSFPVSGSFQMSQYFPSAGQSTGVLHSSHANHEVQDGAATHRSRWWQFH